MSRNRSFLMLALLLLLLAGCSTKKNTSQTRFWHSFTARYNTYYNGSQAFLDGSYDKEKSNKDNYTVYRKQQKQPHHRQLPLRHRHREDGESHQAT